MVCSCGYVITYLFTRNFILFIILCIRYVLLGMFVSYVMSFEYVFVFFVSCIQLTNELSNANADLNLRSFKKGCLNRFLAIRPAFIPFSFTSVSNFFLPNF